MASGKTLIICVIGATIGAQLIALIAVLAWGFDAARDLVLQSVVSLPPTRVSDFLVDQFVSSGLTVLICVALYRGHAWARWVSVLLYGLGLALFVAVSPLLLPPDRWSALLLFLALVYMSCLVALLMPQTSHFLRAQRLGREARRPAA